MIQMNWVIGSPGRYADEWRSYPNSVGGVSVRAAVKNVGTKTIKYYYLFVLPYNAVNDVVYCPVTKESRRILKGTGPLSPDSTDVGTWEDMWYNPTIQRVEVEKVQIEYMDGTSETIPGSEITNIQRKRWYGLCVATVIILWLRLGMVEHLSVLTMQLVLPL